MTVGMKPHARRNWLKAVRALMQFAVSIGLIGADPTTGIKVKVPKSDGHRTWGETEIDRFRGGGHALGTRPRLAFELLLCTVQRRGDVIRLGPQHIRDGLLCVRQNKTGANLTLPVLPELQAALDAAPSGHLTFLTTARGTPFSGHAFSDWFRQACNAAGLRGFTAHGLRKAGCRRLAEAGATTSEIAAWSGHKTLGEVARYTRAADQTSMAHRAAGKLRRGAGADENETKTAPLHPVIRR